MKTLSLGILAGLLLVQGCTKDNNPTPDAASALKQTEWYGSYQNKGESGRRGYALVLNSDSSFAFYGADFTHEGYWSVHGHRTIRFRFAAGAQNSWTAEISADSLKNFSMPSPDNFSFVDGARKIATPPTDVMGHVWSRSTVATEKLIFSPTKMVIVTKDSSTLTYTSPPYKNKIFRNTTIARLLVVDTKTAWQNSATIGWEKYEY